MRDLEKENIRRILRDLQQKEIELAELRSAIERVIAFLYEEGDKAARIEWEWSTVPGSDGSFPQGVAAGRRTFCEVTVKKLKEVLNETGPQVRSKEDHD